MTDTPANLSGLKGVVRQAQHELEEAVSLVRSLRELGERHDVENKHALEGALRDALEDAESAVIHYRAARAELWRAAAAVAESPAARRTA